MEADLGSFLSPAGSLLGEVTQRVLSFLSVHDLVQYVASTANTEIAQDDSADDWSKHRKLQERSRSSTGGSSSSNAGAEEHGCIVLPAALLKERLEQNEAPRGQEVKWLSRASTEGCVPRHVKTCRGGGDEAGGSSRASSPHRVRAMHEAHPEATSGTMEEGDEEQGRRWVSERSAGQDDPNFSAARGLSRGGGVKIVLEEADMGGKGVEAARKSHKQQGSKKDIGKGVDGKERGPNLLGILIGLSLKPFVVLGAIPGGVLDLLRGVPLLSLLRWAAGTSAAILGVSFKVALLPYDITRGAISYVVGSLEAMLNVAVEIWFELRHLSLAELAVVVSCVVSGNPLPDFLLNPLDPSEIGSGSSCGVGGTARILSRSSRGTTSQESGAGYAFSSEYQSRRSRGSGYSDDSRSGLSGSRGAWRQAHAMRRRLDRVNRTASLVSYEERAESAVPRAKAQRVRRRMHYAMSLQCFQATVTVDGRHSPTASDGSGEDDAEAAGGVNGAGGGSSSSFICTPQSFPPTPVSRAHVMARTSQFADDILFLARDQLRLGENLKPGVDETTRATADFLRRQQRLAVLDGNNACEGIVLTCGHHRATKIGPSLYSSARAMVPVLRNRHVYFQVSCMRDGPLTPSIGVGLSTPEMPLSTLVGAFSNSVGLCSTGQILMSSRWYGVPGETAVRQTGMSTIGVLVYLDGSRSFRSWDGDMVRAIVSFSVDGRLVRIAVGHVPSTIPTGSVPTAPGIAPEVQLQQQLPVYGPLPPPPGASAASTMVGGGRGDVASSSWATHDEIAPWESAATSALAASIAAASTVVPMSGPGAQMGCPGTSGRAIARPSGAGARGGAGNVTTLAHAGSSAEEPGRSVRPAVAGTPAPVAHGASGALGLAVPKDRDLFPTVTIHSANTEVLCRFCAEDLLPVTRESIGAPPGVAVYALDGSLIDIR